VQNSLPLPSPDEKNELGRWRNTKALIVPIHGPAVVARESASVASRSQRFVHFWRNKRIMDAELFFSLCSNNRFSPIFTDPSEMKGIVTGK
jgi:hypothetical protein